MSQVRLKSLDISGFRSFVNDCHIEFPETGLVLITGGSGIGKSSIPLAAAYVLGFCPFPATELVSWGGIATLKVEGTFDTPQGLVRVRRSPNLQVWVDGEQVRGGTKKAEERLYEILGLPPELLALLTYRGQRKPGLFLSMTDGEKKEFLMKLLGLDKFEIAIEEGTKRITELERKLTAAAADHGRLSQLVIAATPQKNLSDTEAEIEHHRSLKLLCEASIGALEMTQDDLVEAREKVSADAAAKFADSIKHAEAALKLEEGIKVVPNTSSVIDELQNLASQIKSRLDRALAEDTAKMRAHQAQLAQLNKDAAAKRVVVSRIPGLEAEYIRLSKELEALGRSVCPTCEREWENSEKKKSHVLEHLAALHDQVMAAREERALLDGITKQIAEYPEFVANPTVEKLRHALTAQQEKVATEQQRIKSLVNEANAAVAAQVANLKAELYRLKNEQLAAVSTAQSVVDQKLQKNREQIAATQVELREVDGHLVTCKLEAERIRTQLTQKASLEAELQKADVLVRQLSAEVSAEKDFLGLIGKEGFLGSIFDEILAEISDEANRLLGTVANTRHCTIEFRSEVVTQKGTVNKKIVPVVSVGGNETNLTSGLSGGMLSTVELITDLAVGAVVSRRAGVCPGWLILDESFEGLDTVSKESCMDVLTRYAQDRLVLVIDHATEFRALFTQEIQVQHINGSSTATTRTI